MSRLAPAERVTRLRQRFGSHDKLAQAITDMALGLAPTRQRIIQWEQGSGISPKYARALAELSGGKMEDFLPEGHAPRPPRIHQEVQRIANEVKAIRRALEERGIDVPESQ